MVKKSKLRFLFILGFLFLISSAAVAYPFVSNYFSELRQSKVVTDYDTAVAALKDADGAAALEAARAYNAALANGQAEGLCDYDALLNPTGNGMMGVVAIPAIDVELPIYHGTQSLELGALHLQGTSLPVGGASTHVSFPPTAECRPKSCLPMVRGRREYQCRHRCSPRLGQ